jgi:hypothetical protein
MRINSIKHRTSLFALAMLGAALLTVFALWLTAQEEVLKSSNPDLRALRSQRNAIVASDPKLHVISTDAQALQILDEAANDAKDELRAAIDLLAVYENLQCEPDRTMMRPLLQGRLSLYARLLGLNIERAAIQIDTPGGIKLQKTYERALKMRDNLLAAKNNLDSIAASLK